MSDESEARAKVQREKYEKYRQLFTSPLGREVLHDMKTRAFCFHSTFVGNVPQHLRDAREGMRDFMLETESFIEKALQTPQVLPTKATSATTEEEDAA